MPSNDFLIDDSDVMRKLSSLARSLTTETHKKVFTSAARAGGHILKKVVRSKITGTKYEHIGLIKRNVKVFKTRSRTSGGINVFIKGVDVQVGQGRTRRFWRLSSYSMLVQFGNLRSRPRRIKTGVFKGKSRGNVSGIVNRNIFKEAVKTHGATALRAVSQRYSSKLQQEINRA